MQSRPIDQRMQNFGAANQPGGRQKAFLTMGFLARAGLGGGALAVLALVLQVATPFKPFSMLGTAYGDMTAQEHEAARVAAARYAEAQADAAARAEARKTEQIMLAQQVQATQGLLLTPQVAGSWAMQGTCLWGMFDGDSRKRAACGMVQPMNQSIMQQQASVIDTLGPTRMWGDQPGPASAPTYAATADDPPLSNGDYERIAFLEKFVDAGDVQRAQAGLNMNSNRGVRMYIGRLVVAADAKNAPGDPGTPRDGQPHFTVQVTHKP